MYTAGIKHLSHAVVAVHKKLFSAVFIITKECSEPEKYTREAS